MSRPRDAHDDASAIQVTTSELPVAMAGESYETWFEPCGAQYAWKLTGDGALPPGLNLSNAGVLSGKPKDSGSFPFTVMVSSASTQTSGQRDLTLVIRQKLEITTDVTRRPGLPAPDMTFIADLHAKGGTPPYEWRPEPGSAWPGELKLDPSGRITWSGNPMSMRNTRLTVRCTDQAGLGYHATAGFFIRARLPRRWWRRPAATAQVSGIPATATIRPALRTALLRATNYLIALGLGLPGFGAVMILMYGLTAPGSKLGHLGVAFLTAFTAFLVGILIGFLFGIPRAISSGQARQTAGPQYAPSTNLAEVSDWLTKLLLGAGLVQLTRLGAPIGALVDTVARGLISQPPVPAYVLHAATSSAQVMAGAILFGYTAVGLLDGYLMTTTWYQSWIVRHGAQ